MKLLPNWLKAGYLRLIDPVAVWLVRLDVHPNTITTVGTLCTISCGVLYGLGHIRIGGWLLGLTALFDVLDGEVARRTERSSVFGAFYDSTLDRVADGAVLGGLALFYATDPVYHSVPMLSITLVGIIGTFLTSYTRARAEGLGIDAKVGVMQRPERVVLLSVPQAFFGVVFNGWVLAAVVALLALTAWITAIQRILFVRTTTQNTVSTPLRVLNDKTPQSARTAPRRAQS